MHQQRLEPEDPLNESVTILIRREAARSLAVGETACLAVAPAASVKSSNAADIQIGVAFLPVPIKKGFVEIREFYIGITGARFRLDSEHAQLADRTPRALLNVQYESSTKSGSTNQESYATGGKSPIGVKINKSNTVNSERKAKYSHGEYIFEAVELERSVVWSLRPHLGEKAVAEYLQGNLHITAEATWESSLPVILSKAEPTDRRFFDSRGRFLSGRKFVALLAKLIVSGFELPSIDPIIHSLTVLPRRENMHVR